VRALVAIAVVFAAGAAGAGAGVACDRPAERHKRAPDTPRARRVITPSTDRVGPLPPYAIRADGVGPYKIGDKLSDLLERLPSGPRIALFEIPGVVHRNVIRAEDDTILIGGEQASTASFVAVVDAEVARTESGIHVGSTRDETIAALGAPVEDPERARDPRLLVPGSMATMRAVVEGDRVAAIVVAANPTTVQRASDCQRPAPRGRAIGACLTAAGELIEVGSDDVVVRSADGERTLAPPLRLSGLVFAAPLHSAAELRDELAVITRTEEAASRTWWLAAYRLEGSRLVRSVEATPLYQLSSTNARWIGAELRDIELYLELVARPEAIEVGGLLTTRATTKIRDVVVIAPASVVRKRTRAAQSEPGDASVTGPSFTMPGGRAASPGPAAVAPVESAPASGSGAASSPSPSGPVMPDAGHDVSETTGGESEPTGP
jgi:hypothetical protein